MAVELEEVAVTDFGMASLGLLGVACVFFVIGTCCKDKKTEDQRSKDSQGKQVEQKRVGAAEGLEQKPGRSLEQSSQKSEQKQEAKGEEQKGSEEMKSAGSEEQRGSSEEVLPGRTIMEVMEHPTGLAGGSYRETEMDTSDRSQESSKFSADLDLPMHEPTRLAPGCMEKAETRLPLPAVITAQAKLIDNLKNEQLRFSDMKPFQSANYYYS